MAITAEHLAITLNYAWAGEQMQTRTHFRATGAAFLTATAAGVGEAFWNHVKAVWRALVPAGAVGTFVSIFVEEIGGGLAFGEYAIPSGESNGTRGGALGEALPPFMAAGVKFTVGTRLTRPGAMRIPFMYETDLNQSTLQTTYFNLCQSLATTYASDMVLGAPVATGVLHREVIRWTNTVPPEIYTTQNVIGAIVNPNVTTQLSRKLGRGM